MCLMVEFVGNSLMKKTLGVRLSSMGSKRNQIKTSPHHFSRVGKWEPTAIST